jgi:exonuclease SbcD
VKLRILACADLHLGMKFAGYPEVQGKLSEARFLALERLVAAAAQGQCRLLLIAGDLFDRLTVAAKEVRRAVSLLNAFEGELVAVLPGNHDFYSGADGGLWKVFREQAGDRLLLLLQAQPYDLQHYGLPVRLYPGPCHDKHSRQNAIGWIPGARGLEAGRTQQEAADLLRIGVAHGAVEGVSFDAQGDYYSMSRAELDAAGLDLWVVGHTHRQRPEDPSSGDRLFIPGTPEPDGFDCPHRGTAWVLETEAGKAPVAHSIGTGSYRFYREQLQLASPEKAKLLLQRLSSAEFQNTLVRLDLLGRLPRQELAAFREGLARVEEGLFWHRIDDSGLLEEITSETIEGEFSHGSFPYLLLKKLIDVQDYQALQTAYELLQEARR